MAFKKMTEYNEEKFGNFLRIVNDRDYADVIFLYESIQDVLIAKAHYIKSRDYSGYVQCLEHGCPVCAEGIRTQDKLFIPVLVLANSSDPEFRGPRLQFWDRTLRFQPQLMQDVFRNYPNPSDNIFRIVRHGAANSIDTYYSIQAISAVPESYGSYEQILADNNITMPDAYDLVCKDYPAFQLKSMLDAPKDESAPVATYGAKPRDSYTGSASTLAEIPSEQEIPSLEPTYVTPEAVDLPEPPQLDASALGVDESIDVEDIADDVNF